MSAPFLTTTVADMRIAVEVAWGADLTDLTGASWVWDDITDDVVLKGNNVSIGLGRPDFSGETQTAEMTCELDNRSGAYSEGGLSPHWPNVQRGTPVRVRVSNNGGTTWFLRFQGTANGFTPQWDADTGRWATVELSASGPLRRLNQGTGVGISAMREGTLADPSVKLYWPCEDRVHSTFVAPAVGTSNGRFRVYDPDTGGQIDGTSGEMASYSDIASSGPIVTLAAGGDLGLQVPDTTITTGASTVTGFFGNITGIVPYDGTTLNYRGTPQQGAVMSVFTADASSVKVWCITYQITTGTGRLRIQGFSETTFNLSDTPVFTNTINFHLLDNTPYEVGLSLAQSGSTTDWQLFRRQLTPPYPASSFSGSVGSNSNGANVTFISAGSFDDSAGLAVGHVVVRDTIVNSVYDSDWGNGYPGETVTDRLTRLCTTHGLPLNILDSSVTVSPRITDTMGPQFYDTLTNLLRECEVTGQGVLYDGLGPGLTYVTQRRRESNATGPALLVIDAAQAQLMEPFSPVDDDQLTINHVDVARRGGTDQTYSKTTGPMSVDAIGDYATAITVNTVTDDGLVGYAEWLTNVGTEEGYRYPSVSFALEANPSLIPGWLTCTPQSRIDVTNVQAVRRQHPAETIKLLLEGWHESINAFTWRVTANTSQAAPWNVVVAAADTGSTGDGILHMETDDSQLNADAAEDATSISVRTNSGPRWVNSSEDADSFPFDIDIGGVQATVTAISGTSSPQTFTLAAGLPRAFTGSTTTGAGTPIRVWRPPVVGL